MTPEAARYLEKGRQHLDHGRAILAINLGDDAGRSAYLAAFHAAQAFIFQHTGKTANTHEGVHREFNLLADLPQRLDGERFDQLLQVANVRIERIVSTGQSTPAGEWYDQAWDEWVLVIQRLRHQRPPDVGSVQRAGKDQ